MKREVTELPVLPPLQDGWHDKPYEVRWQVAGGWAVGDCYQGREYRGRYVIDRQGRHGMVKGRERVVETLAFILGGTMELYGWPGNLAGRIACQKDEEQEVRGFLDPLANYAWKNRAIDVVLDMEESFNSRERRNAEKRKQDKIDSMMAEVPPLPDNLLDWMREKVWPNDFLFPSDAEYDTEEEHGKAFFCTACGRLHRYNKPPKLREAVRCPETGRLLVRKRKGAEIKEYERVMVLQFVSDVWSVARHIKVWRWLSEGNAAYEVDEDIRIVLYHRDRLAETLGLKKKLPDDKVYYGQQQRGDEYEQEWGDHNPWTKHMFTCWCYPEGIKDALSGTIYEKTPVGKMAEAGWKLHYNQIMLSVNDGRLPGILECMTAMNLKKLVTNVVDRQLSFGRYYGSGLNLEGTDAVQVLGIDRQRIQRLVHLNGGKVMLAWLKWEQQNGGRIRDEVLFWMERECIEPLYVSFILDRMSPEQVKNYITRERGAHTVQKTFDIWKDYLSMAERLGLDVDDEIIYRTKGLFARHDEAVEEFERRKAEIEAEEFERKYGGITRACARIREKFDYVGEKFCVITPGGAQDIIEDSRQLHHCAGASERYYERIEQDETYILFLRRTEAPEKAYYTLEVEPDGTTRQKRSEYNRQPDLQEINAFLREWQAVVRKRLKEADKEAARVSAAKREEEMAALAASDRQRDIDLYTALANDLLAANY